jgi:hypothetical protein
MPLAQVGDLPAQLETWVDEAVRGKVRSATRSGTWRGKRAWVKPMNMLAGG